MRRADEARRGRRPDVKFSLWASVAATEAHCAGANGASGATGDIRARVTTFNPGALMPESPVGQPPSSAESAGRAERTAGVIAPPPLLYAVPLVVGLLLQHWYPHAILPPGRGTILGIVLLLGGLVGAPAITAFRRADTSPKPWVPSTALVTSGPYRFTRNPMYLGFTLIYLGMTFWANSAWPLLFLPFVLIAMHYGVILREEAYMADTFGEEYEQYRARVRRWV